MKKAQMEIMGLVIIVILLALGMFLLVRFLVIEQPEEVKKTFTSKELATNMISTLLKADSGCGDKNLDMTELMIAHAEFEEFTCNGDDIQVYLEDSIKNIFNQTLGVWNIQYQLDINFPADRPDVCLPQDQNGDCIPCEAGRERRLFPLPSDYGIILVRMDICT